MIQIIKISTRYLFLFSWLISFNTRANSPDISNLPIKEFDTNTETQQFVILFTGDGGWKPLVREMADFYRKKGIPVVGLDVQKYFWDKKSPQEIGHALESIISHYKTQWNKSELILIGYSMGAEVLPFAVNQLKSQSDINLIKNIVLIAPNRNVQFEIKLINYISTPTEGQPLLPELKKLNKPLVHIICDDDPNALCNELSSKDWDSREVDGGHHFGKDYDKINQTVWNMTEGH